MGTAAEWCKKKTARYRASAWPAGVRVRPPPPDAGGGSVTPGDHEARARRPSRARRGVSPHPQGAARAPAGSGSNVAANRGVPGGEGGGGGRPHPPPSTAEGARRWWSRAWRHGTRGVEGRRQRGYTRARTEFKGGDTRARVGGPHAHPAGHQRHTPTHAQAPEPLGRPAPDGHGGGGGSAASTRRTVRTLRPRPQTVGARMGAAPRRGAST